MARFYGDQLEIQEYIPKGMVSARLFPLNSHRVHQIAKYWVARAKPIDDVRLWVMSKETKKVQGFHTLDS